jgi:uncharacterized protein (TIGR00255 family)
MFSLRSMTGFGRARGQVRHWQVDVELRAVNQRGLEARMSLPAECRGLEARIHERIRQRLHRGRVEGRLELTPIDASSARGQKLLAEGRFAAILEQLKHLSRLHGLDAAPTLSDVLRFSEQLIVDDEPMAEIALDEETQATIIACVDEALDALIAARLAEGAGIGRDLQRHLDDVEGAIEAIASLYPREQEAFRARLDARLRDCLERFGVDLDESRLAQEFVLYADRSDVSEELQRARSHVHKLRNLVESRGNVEPVGKTLDFYLQELMREANTTASKSNSAALTDHAVAVKVSVEKMREQVANVE